MLERLRDAGVRFAAAARAADPSAGPLSEADLDRHEAHAGTRIPEPWRAFLRSYGPGPKKARFDLGSRRGALTLSPDDALEHQVETDAGRSIAASGGWVIGYFDGLGACVVMTPGEADPVLAVGDREIRTLSTLIETLTAQLEAWVKASAGPVWPLPEALPRTPLHDALGREDADALRAAIAEGADVDARARQYGRVTTPLHMALLHAHRSRDTTLLEILLEARAELSAADDEGRTVLHLAAAWGRPELAAAILRHGPDVNARDVKGQTPLMLALAQGNADIDAVLWEADADGNAVDAAGTSVLMLLCRTCAPERIRRGVRHGARRGADTLDDNARFWLQRAAMEAASGGDDAEKAAFAELGVA